MKRKPSTILVTLLLCFVALLAVFKVYTLREQDNVKDALVRALIIPKFSGIYFISFNEQDPSDEFLRRFQGDSFSVKKKSQAISSTNMFRDTIWKDKATGVRGGAWGIGDVSWRGPFKAKVIVNT
jgi:hypothetical protein